MVIILQIYLKLQHLLAISLKDLPSGLVSDLILKDPNNRDKIEQGQKNLEKAIVIIETTNGTITALVPGGSVVDLIDKINKGEGMAALATIPLVILDIASAGDGKIIIKAGAKIWSSTKEFTSVENAFNHFVKHANEFPGIL